jgi:tripartite-type tricarboxylate transporter receptor subunit TctC
VVPPQLKIKTFKEFLDLAKSRNEPIAFASCGIGCSQHLGFELLKNTYDFKGLHVPYKGGQEPMTAVMAGQVDALLADLAGALPFIKDGKMVALGVAGPQRAVQAPDIPTLEEASGKAFTSGSWWGFILHANTKPEVRQVLEREFSAALQRPDLREKMGQRGITLHGTSSEEFGAFMNKESERFAQAIKLSGTKLE